MKIVASQQNKNNYEFQQLYKWVLPPINHPHITIFHLITDIAKFQHMEEYPIAASDQQQFNDYRKMFEIRIQDPYIVKILYFNSPNAQLCGYTQTGYLLIERIPYRLSQFEYLPYSQALSIMKICLQGYSNLFEIYGLFNIQSTMIGINQSNNIKIWHHTDLSAPKPQNPYCDSLNKMIKVIIQTVQNSAEYPDRHQSFQQHLQANLYILHNFEQTLSCLQQYCQKYKILLTNAFPNIQSYFKLSEGLPLLGQQKQQQQVFNEIPKRTKIVSKQKYSFKNNSMVKTRSLQKANYSQSLISIAKNSTSSRLFATPTTSSSNPSRITSIQNVQNLNQYGLQMIQPRKMNLQKKYNYIPNRPAVNRSNQTQNKFIMHQRLNQHLNHNLQINKLDKSITPNTRYDTSTTSLTPMKNSSAISRYNKIPAVGPSYRPNQMRRTNLWNGQYFG